jgi:hypothetical protein
MPDVRATGHEPISNGLQSHVNTPNSRTVSPSRSGGAATWHWRVVIALGASWLLDGLEVTVVGSLGPALPAAHTRSQSHSSSPEIAVSKSGTLTRPFASRCSLDRSGIQPAAGG